MAVETAVLQNQLPGGAAAVRFPDGSVWFGQQGLADLENYEVFNLHTQNGIGSITKTFTSTAFLIQADRGLIGLDDTIEEVLPGLLGVGGQVTMRQLLNMSSGLNHYETTAVFEEAMNADRMHSWTAEEIAKLCDGLAYTPGDHFDYNNGNYFILALAMEAATGRTWQDIIERDVLAPLHLDSTGIMEGAAQAPAPGSVGYACDNRQVLAIGPITTTTIAGPSGAMYSTTIDLLDWMTAFLDGRLLSDRMQAERMTPQVVMPGQGSFGLGIAFRSNGAIGFAGNFDDFYSGEWEHYRGYDIVAVVNGFAGPYQGWKSSASSIFYEIAKLINAN